MAEIAGIANANQLCDQSPLLPPMPPASRVHHHRGQFQAQASVTSGSSGGGGSSSCSAAAAAAGERPLKIGVLGTKGVGKTGTHPADLLIKYLDVGPQAQLPPPYAEDISALLTMALS